VPDEGNQTQLKSELVERCQRARAAAIALAPLERAPKDRVLLRVAELLLERTPAIIAANAKDVDEAKSNHIDDALIDRLVLDAERIQAVAEAVRDIARFDDPVGEMVGTRRLPSGLLAGQQRIPLGVIAMIYESRPNVTIDAAALCLKSGNAVLLRGGKEAKRSNAVLGEVVRDALTDNGLPADAVQIIEPMGREETKIMVGLSGMIDLLIPRGGEGLIRFVAEHARVPVVQHYKGVCHLYVDEQADIEMAFRLIENGKMSRPGVCNALECALIHERHVETLLPRLSALSARDLEIRADERALPHIDGAKAATEGDWGEEFLAKILALRVVTSFDEAVAHIARYGSLHTEAICTDSYANAQRFMREVDASCVMVNASTRFNDGGMLGLGAEVGISTTKLHAYGPMGLASLTALKWVVQGTGHVR
jgi:glutamate-5-semialdehyde dehydrogenase